MDNKYYIPENKELYIGYTAYVNSTDDYLNNTKPKEKTNLTLNHIVSIYNGYLDIETKYLDKEDIESLGWVKLFSHEYIIKNKLVKYTLVLHEENKVSISYFDYDVEEKLFYGNIKSINELIKVMEFLNIKIN